MTKSEEYHEGDLIRVTDKETGEGFQTRARKCPDRGQRPEYENTLFLASDWSKPWQAWTFLSWYLQEYNDYTVELIERSPDPLPTEPGYYLIAFENDERVWEYGNGDWFEVNTNPDKYDKPSGFVKIERLYTRDEVMTKARKVAFEIDPDYLYGGPEQVLLMKLGESL